MSIVVVVAGSIVVFLIWLFRFSYLYVDVIGVCVGVVVGAGADGTVFAIMILFLFLIFCWSWCYYWCWCRCSKYSSFSTYFFAIPTFDYVLTFLIHCLRLDVLTMDVEKTMVNSTDDDSTKH